MSEEFRIQIETRLLRDILESMKTFPSARGAAFALLLGCLATSALRAELSKSSSNVEVSFSDPDSFTDARLGSADPYRDSVFSAIRVFLSNQAGQMLPAGYQLKVTFTDIDLGHRHSRGISGSAGGAPSFEFNYTVTDESGTAIRHGSENLRFYIDFANYRYSESTTDLSTEAIQGEKPVLKNWVVRALDGLKQNRLPGTPGKSMDPAAPVSGGSVAYY